ncbi:MAG: hypothetical protein MUO63_08635 [Desulfobulbaceae bacterium]|nr:hypothetical protein [Desulfobulbaceae bacterium]
MTVQLPPYMIPRNLRMATMSVIRNHFPGSAAMTKKNGTSSDYRPKNAPKIFISPDNHMGITKFDVTWV